MKPIRWFKDQSTVVQLAIATAVVVVGGVAILLVTIVAAAVIGSFVLGMGSDVGATAPSAEFEVSTSNGDLVITHAGGDAVDADDLIVRVNDGRRGTWATLSELDRRDQVSADDQLTVDGVSAGDELRLLYEDPDGGEHTLVRYEAP